MRKIFLSLIVIVMVAVLGIGLTACNNATPQGQLANILNEHSYEKFEYEVLDTKDDSTGLYTVELQAFKKNSSVDFGTRTLSDVKEGIRVKGLLIFGDTTYEMGCYYNLIGGTISYMTPAYSYRTITVNGENAFEMQGKYNGSTFECERYVGDDTLTDSVKLSGTIFDNNQFQQGLRSVTTFASGLNLTFSTPVVNKNGVASATLTASGSSTTRVKEIGYTDSIDDLREEGIECYRIELSRSTQVAGMSQTLFYAVNDIKFQGWKIKNALVKIIEPYTSAGERYEMHYNLLRVVSLA